MTKLTPEQIEQNVIAFRGWLKGEPAQRMEAGAWIPVDPPSPCSVWTYPIRLKPTPKLRPWRIEEVPVGGVIRLKNRCNHYVIEGAFQPGFANFDQTNHTFMGLLENYEWHWPHETNWLPCGVMEDAS